MSVVKINAITVPEGRGADLEARFAARKHAVDGAPGFEGFELLRPVKGEDRYFVVTRFDTEENFEAWRSSRSSAQAHGDADGEPKRQPVATGADLLEFEVVDLG